ncbi:uncharacterized protein PAC_16939 [Phialocephala subalpina]|uniref:Uncharacterized protein n=1 Tax=Phialocephala subalpina TaxID=576137 RepID=A0A1L7XPS5_9HELO|nr:uncharacterized protein PAC_16939 [Phialocephala subalpina]
MARSLARSNLNTDLNIVTYCATSPPNVPWPIGLRNHICKMLPEKIIQQLLPKQGFLPSPPTGLQELLTICCMLSFLLPAGFIRLSAAPLIFGLYFYVIFFTEEQSRKGICWAGEGLLEVESERGERREMGWLRGGGWRRVGVGEVEMEFLALE